MKVLILSDPGTAGFEIGRTPTKFMTMIKAIEQGGLEGTHYFVGTTEELKAVLKKEHPDIIFSAAYYTLDEAGKRRNIHGLLEAEGLPYIGSDETTLELVLSKAALKDKWMGTGISTPDYFVVSDKGMGFVEGLDKVEVEHDFPYIVKPSKGGNSRGILEDSIVFSSSSLKKLVHDLLASYNEILVEQYLGRYEDIREFTVAMIGNGDQMILMPCEIVFKVPKALRVITTSDKDEHRTRAISIDDHGLYEESCELANKAFHIAEVRDYSRLDVIYAGGKFYAIEINGQPMVPDKWFEACARGVGLDKEQYMNAIFLAGISRNRREGNLKKCIPSALKRVIPIEMYERLVIDTRLTKI